MKYTLLTIALLFCGGNVFAQAVTYPWATSINGPSQVQIRAFAIDDACNTYVAGYFSGDSVQIGSSTFHNSGTGGDVFVAKIDANGAVAWGAALNGNASDFADGIAVDGAGNVYIAGVFNSSMFTLGSFSVIPSGNNGNAFVAKLNASGTPQWLKSIGGTSHGVMGQDVSVNQNGDVAVLISFNAASIVFANDTLYNSGPFSTDDVAVVRYDTDGNMLWARDFGGASSEVGYGIAIDNSGSIYFTGTFRSDSVQFNNHVIYHSHLQDIFTARLDAGGNALWAHAITGTSDQISNGIAIDPSGNAYITGTTTSDISVGADVLTSNGLSDIILVKYSATGTPLWARSIGGSGNDIGTAVSAGANGPVVAAYFESSSVQGPFVTHTNSGSTDALVLYYDHAGVPLWSHAIGTSAAESLEGAAMCNGYAYVAGSYRSTLTLGTTTLTVQGLEDVFVAKVDVIVSSHSIRNTHALRLTPNPASNAVRIERTSDEPCTVEVFNVLGARVAKQTVNSRVALLDVSALVPGIYSVRVAGHGWIASGVLVIE